MTSFDFTTPDRRGLLAGSGFAAAAFLVGGLRAAPAEALTPGASPSTPNLAHLDLRENPFGPSPMAVKAILEQAPFANRYAVDEKKILTDYIANLYGVQPEMVVLGNGSKPILAATGAYMARKGGDMLTADRTYKVLYESAAAFGATLVQVPLTAEHDWDFAAMEQKLGPTTAGVYLCNPNGSTGRLADTEKLKAFIIEASRYAPVFVDETYLDMTDGYPANSMMPLVASGHNVIVSRTLSKLHGLAGQRLGYAVGPVPHVKAVQALLTDHVNRVAVVAGLASLKDVAYQRTMRVKLAAGRQKLIGIAEGHGLKYIHGSVLNGVTLDLGMPVETVSQRLLAQGVKIAKKGSAEMPTWTSICVGTDPELAMLQSCLGPALQA